MAETPAVPVITKIENDIAWLKLHVITAILATILIAGGIISGIYLFEGLVEKHDARVAAAQQQAEGINTATQAALLAQLQKMQADSELRDTQAQATIQTLVQQLTANRAQAAQQAKNDATLDARSAADRLINQTKASPTDVTVSNDIVSLSLPLTRKVVTDEDVLAEDQLEIPNLQGQVTAQSTLATDAKDQLFVAQKTIAADKDELVSTIKADDAACKVQVDQQAAKGRKRNIWLTILGFVGGAAVRGAF